MPILINRHINDEFKECKCSNLGIFVPKCQNKIRELRVENSDVAKETTTVFYVGIPFDYYTNDQLKKNSL